LSRRPLLAVALLASALSAIVASPAFADPVPLGGSPLNVSIGERGQLQAFRVDRTIDPGIFYHPQDQLGDAGFFLAITSAGPDNGKVFGFDGHAPLMTGFDDYTPGTPSGVSGDGSAGSPLTQTTTYTAGTSAEVTQRTTYVNGSQEFRVHWDVKNIAGGGASLTYKAFTAADFFFEGDDAGTGIFTEAAPRFVGGTNVDSGSSGGFVEVSPQWSRYQALAYPDVWDILSNAAGTTGPTLTNDILATPADNAGAVEWDASLGNGATNSYEVIVRSAVPSALQLNPTSARACRRTSRRRRSTRTGSLTRAGSCASRSRGPTPEAPPSRSGRPGRPWSSIRARTRARTRSWSSSTSTTTACAIRPSPRPQRWPPSSTPSRPRAH
jgi:hypothetical protein